MLEMLGPFISKEKPCFTSLATPYRFSVMRRLCLFVFLAMIATFSCNAADRDGEENNTNSPSALTVWGREIVVFRAAPGGISPKTRVKTANARLTTLPDFALFEEITAHPVNIGDKRGFAFTLGDLFLFGLSEEDLQSASDITLEKEAEEIVARLEDLQQAMRSQQEAKVILRGIIVSLVDTAFFSGFLWLLFLIRKWLRKALLRQTAKLRSLKLREVDLRVVILKTVRPVINFLLAVASLVATLYWVKAILYQFPYTAPWAAVLRDQFESLAGVLFDGLLNAVPGIMVVVIIFLLTRGSARIIDGLLKSFEGKPEDDETWFAGDTAKATRRLVIVLVWIAGVVLAFPYIPGSGSAAFQGIGVMLGLMISLGSTGVVNQVMSGFVALYSGAVRSGEYALVGDVEGTITEVGLLATKVLTPMNEYITVPNAVLVGQKTVNYSRLHGETRTEIETNVSIGYDTPWRQVHAMLLLAAERTSGISKDPMPRVVQTSLEDFYIEYSLRFVPGEMNKKNAVLALLHQHILDVFNEFGVQITSPHFVGEPKDLHVVPEENWSPQPAEPQEGGKQKTMGRNVAAATDTKTGCSD
jgi:small-conductance mechanosensitive channel